MLQGLPDPPISFTLDQPFWMHVNSARSTRSTESEVSPISRLRVREKGWEKFQASRPKLYRGTFCN